MEESVILSVITCFAILIISGSLNCLQAALLTFGKFKTHKFLENHYEHREKLLKYIDKFWDYYFSVTILATLFRIALVINLTTFISNLIHLILNQNIFTGLYKNYLNEKFIVLFISAIFSLFIMAVVSELLPAVIARKRAERVIVSFLTFIKYLDIIAAPFRIVLKKIVNFAAIPLKIPLSEKDFMLEDKDIKILFKAAGNQGLFKKQEMDMINSIFTLKETIVRNIMIPQTDVVAVPVNISLTELIDILTNSGYSRIPVYENNRDNIIGVIHTKELLSYISLDIPLKNQKIDIRKLMHKIIYTPESKEINSLLREFQKEKVHIAVVVDEFGVLAGIITIEDILEEIVGDINDEFDDDEEMITRISDKEFLIDAKINIDDLNYDINLNLPVSDEYESLGGFLIFYIDDLPKQGQIIEYRDYKFEIVSATATRILKVCLKK